VLKLGVLVQPVALDDSFHEGGQMPSVNVKIKYSSTGGAPASTTKISVQVSKKPPTESEVQAAIVKKYPKWNFVILEID
jgi:hypothetical protein